MADVRLQRYQIMEPLGRGAQGTTYRGIDRASGDEVAIKVLSIKGMPDWKGFELFERECRVLARLEHPGIPRFLDHYASEESGDYFLVMGLAAGRSLHARRREGERFDELRLRDLLDQALDILAYLHDRSPPVIHRDIKPSNLVLSDAGRLSLVDFGGVREALRPEGGSTMIGTFGFMAPEQLHGDATSATDIYALGATFASLASGIDPEDMPRAGLRIDLDSILPRHPLREVMAAMLEPDPSQRLQDADAVREFSSGPHRSAKTSRSEGTATPSAAGVARPRRKPDAVIRDGQLARRNANGEVALPDELEQLAKVDNRLFGVLLWLFAAMASGILTLVEAVVLPLFYKIVFALNSNEETRAQLQGESDEARTKVRESRRMMRALAERTSPVDRD